jgi:uncharacterized protein with HEPN domain
MPRDYKLYLEDMLDAIQKVEEYVQGFTFQEFCESDLQVDAVLYNLEIVGEAVKHIPESITAKHPSVEWRKIARPLLPKDLPDRGAEQPAGRGGEAAARRGR